MTCKELMAHEFASTGNQLERVLEGLAPEHQDFKITDKAMSPREVLEHLAEAYIAFSAEAAGGKHSWGTFQIEDRSWDNVLSVFRKARAEAVEAALAGDEDALAHEAHAYIVGHDYYHVGQLALLRVETDPSWDPYSIYR